MSTTLTNGVIIPENGSRNWGGDLANNWNILDVHVGYMNDVKNRVTTLENSVTTLENSVAENTANIGVNASNISALQTSKQDKIEDLETIRAGATAGATAVQPSTLSNYVDLSSEQTISGAKTFSSNIVGNLVGNASNGVNSYGNFWIRFNSGIQLCWGKIEVAAGEFAYDSTTETYYRRYYTYNYAVAFSEEPSLNLAVVTSEHSPFLMVTCESVGSDANRKTGTGSIMLFCKNKNGVLAEAGTYISVFSVGKWR